MWYMLAIGAITFLGVVARMEGLSKRELWYDEVCTHYVVHHLDDWPENGPDPRREVAHRPYFFLLNLWTRIAGEGVLGLRSFSSVAGCLCIAALAFVARGIAGRSTALIAAALAAVHPLHVYYSQEARVYTLWCLEAVVCLFALYKATTMASRRWWIAYAFIAWISVATHYHTLLWLPATVGAVFVAAKVRRFLTQWVWTHVFLACSLVPLVRFFVMPLAERGPKQWLAETWLGYPPILAIPRSLWALLPSGGYPDYLGTLPAAVRVTGQGGDWLAGATLAWGAPFLVAALFLFVAIRTISKRPRLQPQDPRGSDDSACVRTTNTLLFLLTLTVGFLATMWIFSLVLTPLYIVGRYDFFAWPAVTIAVAVLIDLAGRHVGRRNGIAVVFRVAVTGLFFILGGGTVAAAHFVPAMNPTEKRAEGISARIGADDLVISLGMYRWFMSYEWTGRAFAAEVVSFPRRHDRQLCWADPAGELADVEEIQKDGLYLVGEIGRALSRNRPVWLLAHGEPDGPRWHVDMMFFDRLRESGFEIVPEDEWLGLARVVRRAE